VMRLLRWYTKADVNNPSIPMIARMIVDSVINRPPLNVWMCSDEHYRKGETR
jgi:hypothetical protein